MIAKYIKGGERFYSLNARLEVRGNGIWGRFSCTPMLYDVGVPSLQRWSGMLSDEDLSALAELFDEPTFFIPPAHGCYVGGPKLPITRILLLSLGNGVADLHIRCTPLSDMLNEMISTFRATFVRDVINAVLEARQSVIICGRSGIGKTRLMVTTIFPYLASHPTARVGYVETLPELEPVLSQNYPVPEYLYYTILSSGLSRRETLHLGDIIQFMRSSAPEVVVLQEAHTVGTGYASPAELQGLVSSGVPFVITAHPSFESPVETAEYYVDAYGIRGAETVIIQLSDRAISFVHSSAKRALLFCRVPYDMHEEVYITTSRDMPQEIVKVLSLTNPEGGKNG